GGDSLAKGSMGARRATRSPRARGVCDRSLRRLPVAADGALSTRDDRANTFDDLPGLAGPESARRDRAAKSPRRDAPDPFRGTTAPDSAPGRPWPPPGGSVGL